MENFSYFYFSATFPFTVIDDLGAQSGKFEDGDICLRLLRTSRANEIAAKCEISVLSGSAPNALWETTSRSFIPATQGNSHKKYLNSLTLIPGKTL